MRTGLIEWESVPSDDLQVLAEIVKAGNPMAGDGKGDTFGILSAEGSMCREIACDDYTEGQRIAIALQGTWRAAST